MLWVQVMGQELRFDELDGHRGGNGPSSPNDEAATAEPATENGESGAAHPNERVGVEGDLEPYDDLSDDDEEDLRPVPVPRYLRRLIERTYHSHLICRAVQTDRSSHLCLTLLFPFRLPLQCCV